MARKEKLHAKELEKLAIKQIKLVAKKHNAKTIKSFIYKTQDDFFFKFNASLAYFENENAYEIYGDIKVKPYCLDDLFWEVFEISQNKEKPDSLRANGAYVAPSIRIDFIKIKINSEEKLEEICNELLSELDRKIELFLKKASDIKSYMQYLEENLKYENNELLFILLEIEESNYEKALKMIEIELAARKHGGFAAGNKNIYEFARDYCINKLN